MCTMEAHGVDCGTLTVNKTTVHCRVREDTRQEAEGTAANSWDMVTQVAIISYRNATSCCRWRAQCSPYRPYRR